MRKQSRTRPSISDQLRAIIDGCGLTRYQIAKRAGIEQSALSRFMSGERGLSTQTLDALVGVLDLQLITGNQPKK